MSRATVPLLLAVLWPAAVLAQSAAVPSADPPAAPASRAEALEAIRAERAQSLHPETRTRLERFLIYVDESHIIERLNPPQGFYPVAGSLVRGGGLSAGLGYRRRPFQQRVLVDTSAQWSYRNYRSAQLNVGLPVVSGRGVGVTTGVRWFDYPQEDYFGLGRDTRRDDRVSFTLRGVDTFAQVMARRARGFVMRGRLGVQQYDVATGRDLRFPSLEDRFTDATAPGLDDAPTFRYAEAAVGFDTRDQPGNTRGGGLYNLSFGAFRDGSGTFDFNRIDLRLMHVIPIFDKKRAIAFNASASRIDPIGGDRVPFFLMPTVGGTESLRGFRDFRFRDAAAVNLNAEYRWEAFSGLDLALFVDAGDVGPTWRSIVGADLKSSWGMGFRFNTNRRVFLRVDVAGGREGPRIWVATSQVFRR